MSENPNANEEEEGFFQRLMDQPAKARAGFQTLKAQLAEEKDETKVMLEVYRRSLTGDASDEEQELANDQFMDLLRIAGMATFCGFIPGSTLALPLAIAGAKKMGIRLLPSAFDKETDEQDNNE